MGVLFWAVEADPLTGNTAGGEGILVELAGGLTAVIHAKGEVMPADPIGELCLERLVECAEPFDGTTAEACMPADDPAGEHIHNHHEEYLRTITKHKQSHVGCPELIDACGGYPWCGCPVHTFLYPGTEKGMGAHDTGDAFSPHRHAALFSNERPNTSNPPGRVALFDCVNHGHEVFILHSCFTVPFFDHNSIHPGMKRLVWYREYLPLSAKGETRFHQQ
jgi:hypothetical protein